jgi:hypothetical protein
MASLQLSAEDVKMKNDNMVAATAELVSYNPLADLAEAAAKSGCRVTLTLDINPPEPVGAKYESGEERTWTRTA